MSKIWEPVALYRVLRHYVDACTRASYWTLKTEGSLPKEGAVIIAPNHCNTLMDALVVLRSRKKGIVFGARADIFQNPTAAKVLRFLKILPLARERDGAQTIRGSMYAFDEIDDTLAAGVPFCLFPEGRHNPGRILLPIQKGIARIALRSAQVRPTCIVPTGLNYSDFFTYRGRALVRYGKPIDVNAFIEAHAHLSEAELQLALRNEVGARIQELVSPDGLPAPSAWRWLLSPLWPLAALLSLPMWVTAESLCKKLKDKTFSNSVRFLVRLIMTPLLLLLWGLLFFLTMPWWARAALLVLFLFSYSLFYDVHLK